MYGVGQPPPQRRGWLGIIGVLILVLVLTGLFFAFYSLVLKKDGESPTSEATATTVQVAEVATDTAPPPTDTATSELATPATTPTIPPTDTPMPTPTLRPPPEAITISVRARVNLSEGLSLNLRDLPTLSNSTIITQLVAGAEVNVVDGPEDEGDRRWWNVDGGEGRTGWVVEALGNDVLLLPIGWADQLPLPPTPTLAATPTLTPTVVPPTVTPVITPTATPTLAPTATATPAATPVVTPTATPVVTPTATPEGGIPSPTVGGRARVTTQYQYINLRGGPGLGAEAIGKLQDGTVVTILEGPEEADGLRWWKVDDGQLNTGWAAERVAGEVLLVPIP
jgi:uncharacterized protein YgiM (DUF1202 family)